MHLTDRQHNNCQNNSKSPTLSKNNRKIHRPLCYLKSANKRQFSDQCSKFIQTAIFSPSIQASNAIFDTRPLQTTNPMFCNEIEK